MNFSKSVLNKLKEIKRNRSIFIYGPAQSKVPKKNNQYNYQLLIGSNSSKLLSEHISKFEIYLSSFNKKIRWHIDIDPLESWLKKSGTKSLMLLGSSIAHTMS